MCAGVVCAVSVKVLHNPVQNSVFPDIDTKCLLRMRVNAM